MGMRGIHRCWGIWAYGSMNRPICSHVSPPWPWVPPPFRHQHFFSLFAGNAYESGNGVHFFAIGLIVPAFVLLGNGIANHANARESREDIDRFGRMLIHDVTIGSGHEKVEKFGEVCRSDAWDRIRPGKQVVGITAAEASSPQGIQLGNQKRIRGPSSRDMTRPAGTRALEPPSHGANITEKNRVGGVPANCPDSRPVQLVRGQRCRAVRHAG